MYKIRNIELKDDNDTNIVGYIKLNLTSTSYAYSNLNMTIFVSGILNLT